MSTMTVKTGDLWDPESLYNYLHGTPKPFGAVKCTIRPDKWSITNKVSSDYEEGLRIDYEEGPDIDESIPEWFDEYYPAHPSDEDDIPLVEVNLE